MGCPMMNCRKRRRTNTHVYFFAILGKRVNDLENLEKSKEKRPLGYWTFLDDQMLITK